MKRVYFNSRIIFGIFLGLTQSFSSNSVSAENSIELGTLSIESSVRYPTTQIISSQESLQESVSIVKTLEFQEIESQVLQDCEATP